MASSRALGWDGVVAEMGREVNWVADDLTVAGHFIAMNLDSKPLSIESKGSHGFTTITMPPGSLWINPAGRPFTRRNPGITRYGVVEVSLEKIRRVVGSDIDLRYAGSATDQALVCVTRALLLEAKTGGSSGPIFADALGVAVASRLARQFGECRKIEMTRGALDSRLDTVLARVEDTLGSCITVEDLAAVAGLSAAHFAREFKRCTRWTPHAFVMERRVQRARQMIAAGRSIADSAFECGFADQAHLGRAFKKRFGITPSCFVHATNSSRRGLR